MRHFVIVGQRARPSPEFLLSDIPSTSGRMDVLIRCLRAALLISHGVRRDSVVYLCLLGEAAAGSARTVRFAGPAAKYMRPDERSLASVMKKALSSASEGPGFVPVREGIAIANGGLACALLDLPSCPLYLLEEGAEDIRSHGPWPAELAFVLGDHLGLPDGARSELSAKQARSLSVGPVSLHAEDAICLVHNELDRSERA